jgi:hypothetical protein
MFALAVVLDSHHRALSHYLFTPSLLLFQSLLSLKFTLFLHFADSRKIPVLITPFGVHCVCTPVSEPSKRISIFVGLF